MNIREAAPHDRDPIRNVYRSAFPEEERDAVADLAVDLLQNETSLEAISLVAEIDGSVIGHVAFSPVSINGNEQIQGYLLAPLAIAPDHQRHRGGSRLVEYGMRQLSAMGVDVLFVYGDPKYYSRFGFRTEAAVNYIPPYELQYPFGWQAIALSNHQTVSAPVQIACVNPLCDSALW